MLGLSCHLLVSLIWTPVSGSWSSLLLTPWLATQLQSTKHLNPSLFLYVPWAVKICLSCAPWIMEACHSDGRPSPPAFPRLWEPATHMSTKLFRHSPTDQGALEPESWSFLKTLNMSPILVQGPWKVPGGRGEGAAGQGMGRVLLEVRAVRPAGFNDLRPPRLQ